MEAGKNLTEPKNIIDHIAETHLASVGKFKYIAIEVLFKNTTPQITQTFIRGDKSCPYHADILQKFLDTELRTSGLQFNGNDILDEVDVSCPGGGRIIYEPEETNLAIYGYSMGFGQFDHNKAVEIMKRTLKIPEEAYKISFEGY